MSTEPHTKPALPVDPDPRTPGGRRVLKLIPHGHQFYCDINHCGRRAEAVALVVDPKTRQHVEWRVCFHCWDDPKIVPWINGEQEEVEAWHARKARAKEIAEQEKLSIERRAEIEVEARRVREIEEQRIIRKAKEQSEVAQLRRQLSLEKDENAQLRLQLGLKGGPSEARPLPRHGPPAHVPTNAELAIMTRWLKQGLPISALRTNPPRGLSSRRALRIAEEIMGEG
jgi:hypothetical protein